jgi:alkanesulfonate monooxygenase SsuD/methylene tetrahydromethanopterin reductase-like flavin-dependent oxidoreductase (luciferase family)
MRYCLNLPTGGICADARTLAEFAAIAEDAGWDGVFVEDYLVYQNRQDVPTCDPWIALTAMALKTERVRLGTMVTALARRRPWKLARETATLDQLSGGRLTLGVGLGDFSDMSFVNFGEELHPPTRAAMLDEALDVLVGLWSGQPFSYAGRFFQVQETTFLPQPVQQPRIPIWVGGAYPNPRPLRRAARWDGACLYHATARGSTEDSNAPLAPAEIGHIKRVVEQARGASTPFDIVAGGPARGPDWEQERAQRRACAAAGATWCSEWIPPGDYAEMRAAIARGPLRGE